MGGYVQSVAIQPADEQEPINWNRFPFNVPAIKEMGALKLHPSITFLAGENGSGKSTLIEGMAIRLGYGEEGGTRSMEIRQRELDGGLHDYLRFYREPGARRETDGFFLRAESFFNVASRIDEYGREDARIYNSYGGFSLHNRSHERHSLPWSKIAFTTKAFSCSTSQRPPFLLLASWSC
jgi:predicted ATPase